MTEVKFNFSGKRALVTGAGRGIGRALAIALAGAGAETFALSKTIENLQSLSKVNSSIHPVCVDLMDWDATRKAIADVGCIDLLVNNAGVASLQSFLEVDKDSLDELFEVNVKAVVNISQVVAKGMIDRASPGSIVNVSSQASSRALKDHTVYCSTKGALDQLTRVMALELGPHEIRVNSVNPTVVLTDMGKFVWSDEAKGGPMKTRIPLGRFAEESDVVDAIMFLLSDSASMIHGAFLPIDGGFLVT